MRGWVRSVVAGVLALGVAVLAGCGSAAEPASGGEGGGSGEQPAQVSKLEEIKRRGYLIVGVKADVPGFGYLNPETNMYEGYEIDLAKKIAEEIFKVPGQVKFEPVTAKTRIGLLQSGQIDMIIATVTVTEQRKQEVDFSPVYYTDGIQLLVKKDSGITGLKDLDGKTIGVAQGATTRARLEEKAKELGVTPKFAEFPDYPSILAALQAGRVDAFSVDGAILKGYQMQDPSTVILPEKYSEEPYAIATRQGDDDLRDLVAQVITRMQESGELQKLQEKWGLTGQ
ncbi:MAG: transporter substrate-binding domain-containing protein [Firmicutes bacterium]|nr:transporter substrate-binding domain-containing protein [Bacillota bacterium]